MNSRRQPFFHRQRGSVLIVALLLAAVIALSIGSFLDLANTATKLAYRSHYSGVAMNVAETGLEYAMWSVNKQLAGDADAWTNWNISNGSTATQTFSLGSAGGGATAEVKVYINNRNLTSSPMIIARGIVTPSSGPTLEKWIQVLLAKRSKFSTGLVAKNRVTFSGSTASVDSWNSDPNGDGSSIVPYGAGVKNDNGSVGSISIENDSVLTNNADIWGSASTGGDDPTDEVGNNGSILGEDSAAKDTSDWVKANVDPDRIATDFTSSFEEVATPTGGSPITSISSAATLGTAGSDTTFSLANISLSGNASQVLTINGNVTLIFTAATGATALSLTGSSSIAISAGSSLTIYTAGDIAIGGNGVANFNPQPKTLIIYGTATDSDNNAATTHQAIGIKGNGDLKGVIYAPNAAATINGNGNVMGSVVAGSIRLTGNAAFHYDESLAKLDDGEPLGIDEWQELVSMADRNEYADELAF